MRLYCIEPAREDAARKTALMPYASLNGRMCNSLIKSATGALRLPAEEREMFLKKYKTKLCEQHGRVMHDCVEVPDTQLKDGTV